MTVGGWYRFLATAALVVPLLTPSQPSVARQRTPARIEYPSEVNIASGNLQTPKTGPGVTLVVSITSGEFFKGLVRTVGPSGVQFAKDGKPVNYFPEKMDVRIQATAYGGGSTRRPWQMGPKVDADFMQSLRFSISSKGGQEGVPAQVVSSRAYEVPFRELGPDQWEYELEVRFKHVPLTDLLSVVVLSGDGKMLASLTGGLDRSRVQLQPNRNAQD